MSKIILFLPSYETTSIMLLPASILSVAAPLVNAGYEVKIIDQRVNRLWKRDLLNEMKKEPLAIGISTLTGKQILNGLEASRLIKENSNIPVIWGGVHPSIMPRQTLNNKYINYVVIGEGEETFLELVECIKNKNSVKNIKGLGYKENGNVFINQERMFVDLENLSEMPYNLISIEKYVAEKSFATGKLARNIAFYTSRGCPYRCGFCYNKEFNKRKWRGKSAGKVIKEIKDLIDGYGINAFEIEDDEFFVDIERAKKIAELIIEENLNIEIFTSCRVNYVINMDSNYLKLFYEAGFRTLGFGVESGSGRILDLMHKDITIEQVFETIKRLKIAGINSKYYFMAGFPTETIKDLYKTTDLIQKMKKLDPQIRIPAWRIFTPYPGTDLYDLAIKEGWNAPKKLEEWANYDFNTVRMPWVKGKKERIIKNVIFLINYLEMGGTTGRGVFFKMAKIFGKIVDWRWKNHYFSFVPEKYLLIIFLKMKELFLFGNANNKR
ncbi:B12-binding domain-containing radical SAM protein [Patescibacteria group bacterium]|nr:B12-binding domain-containing radical SAM protein [Patescibacteria group bacterium]